MESKVYNQKGAEAGKIALPESVFGVSWNADLVHQVVTSMMSNKRHPVAHTKMRGEVRGGGKKPWKQKGTGRARHGSTRSPIWVGGGVTHGPRNDKNFERKVNKKMKTKALFSILSKKFKDGEILFVQEVALPEVKTKFAKEVLSSFGNVTGFERMNGKKKNALFLALSKSEMEQGYRAFKNIGSMETGTIENLNPLTLLQYKYLVITKPDEAILALNAKMGERSEKMENKTEEKVSAKPKKAPKKAKKAAAAK